MADIEMRLADYPVCDFCSSAEPRYDEPCRDMETDRGNIASLGGRYVAVSRGAWSSCEACHQLIASEKWHTLKRRALEASAARHPELPKSLLADGIEHMQLLFRRNRIAGEPNGA